MSNYVNVPRGAVQSLSFFWDTAFLEWLPGEQPATTGGGGGGGGPVTVANGADVTQGNTADAAWVSGSGTVISLLKKIASAGGSAVSIADGSDVAQGTTTDAASASTVIGLLKNLKAALAGTLAVSGPITDTQIRATALPVSGTVAVTSAGLTNLDVALSTRTKPADQQHTIIDSGTTVVTQPTGTNLHVVVDTAPTTAVTGPLTDTQLRATPVPISGTVTTSPPANATTDVAKFGGTSVTIGQQLAAASIPVILPSATVTTLTPPAAITGFALEAGHLATIDTKTPALGQALSAASSPVVLPAAQITTLTPPAAITGYALEAGHLATIDSVQGAQSDAAWVSGNGTVVSILKKIASAGGSAVSVADGADVAQGTTSDVAWVSGSGTVISLLKKIASAGGSAVSIADGADVAQGTTTDLASASTVIGLLKNLKAALAGTLGISGTVTANAGTNLNTSALALDATLTGGTQQSKITDGTNVATVKAASTLPTATDKALVVTLRESLSTVVTGPLTDTQLRASAVPVSLASAPTTAVTNAGLTNLDVALSTRTKPADQQHTIIDSGTTTVTQATGTNLHVVVDSAPTTTITGTVTANAGTNLNTSALALDATLTGGTQKTKLVDTGGTNVASINSNGALLIQGFQPSVISFSGVSATGAQASQTASGYNIATVTLRTFTGTGPSITWKLQASDDNTNWVDIQGINNNSGAIGTSWTQAAALTAGTAGVSADYTIGAYTNVRINVTAISGTTPSAAFGLAFQTMPYEASPGAMLNGSDGTNPQLVSITSKGTQGARGISTQDLKDSGRNTRIFMLDAITAAPVTEALATVVQWYGNAAVAGTTTPAVVPAGKTLRLTGYKIEYQSLATVGYAVVRIRANTGGVAVLASPLVASFEAGTNSGATTTAVTGAVTMETGSFFDGIELPAGTGIGFSVAGYGPTGSLTLEGGVRFQVIGYEY